jgi:glycosyltransferase involved in cell wall biosynthesis
VPVPGTPPEKSRDPLVVFLARWDRRKRPQLFFELAKAFPRVRFIAFGRSQDPVWDAELRRRYGGLPNLELAGFVDQFENGQVREALNRAWVLVNTAAREGLPTSFLEAMAHRCALLARVDPGRVVERFGFCASTDNFTEGLEALLQGDAWRAKGEAGHGYMREHFELDRVIERHIELYRELAVDGHGRARA